MNRFMVLKGHRIPAAVCLAALVLVATSKETRGETQLYASATAREPGKVYWHTDFNSGWAEAKRRNLPMVIFITSERCRYCDAMKRNTWCSKDIQSRVANDFVAIELKPGRNAKTLSRIKIPAYPTTLLGVPSGKVIAHRVGYQPPAELKALLAEAKPNQLH